MYSKGNLLLTNHIKSTSTEVGNTPHSAYSSSDSEKGKWLALVPFVAFAAAFLVGLVFVVWLAERVKITETETKAGKASHFDSPLGTLDVTPEEELDARLASIPIYPGSLRQSPLSADMVSDHTSLQEVSAAYWTPDAEQTVWDFTGLAAQPGRKHRHGADSFRTRRRAPNSRNEGKRKRQNRH